MTPAFDSKAIAQQLVEARSSCRPVAAADVPNAEAAYALQDAVASALQWFDGGVPGHWKCRQVHTHLAQSGLEVEHVIAREGRAPVNLLDELGLLNSRLFAAHCIFLDEADIAAVGRAGVNVRHAPLGNAAFGAIAPIEALREAGATITLCTDTKSQGHPTQHDAKEIVRAAQQVADRLWARARQAQS